MTQLEQWILDTVANVVRDMREKYELQPPDDAEELAAEFPEDVDSDCSAARESREEWDALEHRLAITLVQARAKEARTMEGAIQINMLPKIKDGVANTAVQRVALQCRLRSKALEEIGMQMATEWPPKQEGTQLGVPDGGLVQ